MVEAGKLRADVNIADLAVSVIASLQGGLLLAEMGRSTRPLDVALDAAIAHLRSFASSGPEPPARVRTLIGLNRGEPDPPECQ
jgi:TetR/AcrR family transcriptional repressor of nem operon